MPVLMEKSRPRFQPIKFLNFIFSSPFETRPYNNSNNKIIRSNLRLRQKTQICKSEETAFFTPTFLRFENHRQDRFHILWKFFKISPNQLEESQNRSQITICERFPLWSFSLRKKINILTLTTGNYSPTLVYYVLVTFCGHEV